MGFVAGAGVLVCSRYLAPGLSGALGSLLAVAIFLALRAGRLRRLAVLVRALGAYGFLLGVLVVAEGSPLVRRVLGVSPVLSGPGPWLLLTAAFAVWLLEVGKEDAFSAVKRTLRQWLPVAGAILAFILSRQVMAGSEAATLLAGGAARTLGAAYPVASPMVGLWAEF